MCPATALVGAAAEAVVFAVVVEEPRGLLVAAQREEELDALVPRDGVVVVVGEDEERRLHLVRLEDGRVTNSNFGDYKIPTIADIPELTTVWLDAVGPIPYSGKAVAELLNWPARICGRGHDLLAFLQRH